MCSVSLIRIDVSSRPPILKLDILGLSRLVWAEAEHSSFGYGCRLYRSGRCWDRNVVVGSRSWPNCTQEFAFEAGCASNASNLA